MEHEFRTCRSSYIVFALLGSVPLIISCLAALRQPSSFLGVLVCLAALAFAFAWLSRFRLVITPEAVAYRSLFGGSQTMQRSEIVAADFTPQTTATESPLTFVVCGGSGRELRINAKVFSLAAIREFSALATPPVPNNSL